MADTPEKSKLGILLWILALFVMVAVAVHQWITGSTNPLRGHITIGEQHIKYRLPRSAENISSTKVVIPDPGPAPGDPPRVLWRCYPTDSPFEVLIMSPESDGDKKILTAYLPSQAAAEKVEYKIEIANTAIPEGDETIILRFKGPVSATVLVFHIVLVFAAMVASTRAGLGAAFGKDENFLPWATLSLIFVGGIILGAFVQKAAFGSYWAGWPFGPDLTDNKALFMFLGWLAACLLMLYPNAKIKRPAIVLASLLALIVYLIPYSLRGSQLDYQQNIVETGE
jgi:hypothetical protein